VMLVAQALIEQGDNVVAVTPSWPNICRAMQMNGASIREVEMGRGDAGWSLEPVGAVDPQEVELDAEAGELLVHLVQDHGTVSE